MFVHRDKISRHGDAVRSILVLEQIAINQGEALFHTGYKDPPFPVDGDADPPTNTGWQCRNNNNNNNNYDDDDDDDDDNNISSMDEDL